MTTDAKAILDVGSEASPASAASTSCRRARSVAAEAQGVHPAADARRATATATLYNGATCTTLKSGDYASGAKHGDLTVLATAGLHAPRLRRSSPRTSWSAPARSASAAMTSASRPASCGRRSPRAPRRPAATITTATASPTPSMHAPTSPRTRTAIQDEDGCPDPDNDGDGIPDANDQCPNEPEDKDGFQDEDGCPDRDNDNDGIPDAADKCPNEPEDKDGFEDDDGCPDQDNDGDGFPDDVDKCPNDPETVNGFEDDDGCPDVRATTGPEERPDRIDLKGAPVAFDRAGKLTPAAKALLTQVATIIKHAQADDSHRGPRRALGTKATGAARSPRRRRRTRRPRRSARRRSSTSWSRKASPQAQIQAVGIGSDRPLGSATRRIRSTSASTSSRRSKGDAVKKRSCSRRSLIAARRAGAHSAADRRRGPDGRARPERRPAGQPQRRGARSRQHRAVGGEGRDDGAGSARDRHRHHRRRDQGPPVPDLDRAVDTVPGWMRARLRALDVPDADRCAGRSRPSSSSTTACRCSIRSSNIAGDRRACSRWRRSSASR